MSRPKEDCIVTFIDSTGELDTTGYTIVFQPCSSSYPTSGISGTQLANEASYMPASDLDETLAYYIYVNGTKTFCLQSLHNSFEFWLSCYDFDDSSATKIPAEGAVHPTDTNGIIYAPVNLSNKQNGKTITVTQITVYFTTDASADDFDFWIYQADLDGTLTEKATKADIGNGETGASSEEILSANISLGSYPTFIKIDTNNANANTDVKIYGIKFEGYFS